MSNMRPKSVQSQQTQPGFDLDDRQLFTKLYPKLRKFAATVADSDVEPDDLVHDALLSVLKNRSLAELENPSAYLKRTILNKSATHRKRAAIWRKLTTRIARQDFTIDQYPSDLAALEGLTPVDRAIIYLADVERLPHNEIANELDLKETAVRKRASRARATLRLALATEQDDLKETP